MSMTTQSQHAVTVRIPAPLRNYTQGAEEIRVLNAVNVEQALNTLGARYRGLLPRILSDNGEPRQFVDIYLGRQNIRRLRGLQTPVANGDVVSIIPAVAGGAGT
jgi:molybdopterin synthase sulfur carrier subunit